MASVFCCLSEIASWDSSVSSRFKVLWLCALSQLPIPCCSSCQTDKSVVVFYLLCQTAFFVWEKVIFLSFFLPFLVTMLRNNLSWVIEDGLVVFLNSHLISFFFRTLKIHTLFRKINPKQISWSLQLTFTEVHGYQSW